MTGLLLMYALIENLDKLFGDKYLLDTKSGEKKRVRIFPQYLPQPKGPTVKPKGVEHASTRYARETKTIFQDYGPADFEDNFPCVIVKFDEGNDSEENKIGMATVNVHFLVGTYDKNPNCQGYVDVLNIIDRIREYLWETRYLDNKFMIEPPLKWYLFDEQPFPVFFGVLETRWEVPRPLMSKDFSWETNFNKQR